MYIYIFSSINISSNWTEQIYNMFPHILLLDFQETKT